MSISVARRDPALRRFPLRRRDVDVAGGRRIRCVAPESSLALLRAGWAEEKIPHWADIWPASVALARHVARGAAFDGRHVVDLGCGIGLAGLAAGLSGARVLLADQSEDALRFAAFNARCNGVDAAETLQFDWSKDRLPVEAGALLLLADVVYEYRAVLSLLAQIERVVERGGEAWVVDPQRPTANDLFAAVRDRWAAREDVLETSWEGVRHRLRFARVGGAAP